MTPGLIPGATLSECRRYRYRLWRGWGDVSHRCVFVGLNPSTADETKDDPTIRKCVGFAKRWGFGAVDMVNLFGWRSTSPSGLLPEICGGDPVGPGNEAALVQSFDSASRIVWCWGSHGPRILRMVRERGERSGALTAQLPCESGILGRAKDGSPRHPLMLAYATEFRR